MPWKPGDEPFHLIDGVGLGRTVLPRPAIDLTADIVLAATEVRQTERGRIE